MSLLNIEILTNKIDSFEFNETTTIDELNTVITDIISLSFECDNTIVKILQCDKFISTIDKTGMTASIEELIGDELIALGVTDLTNKEEAMEGLGSALKKLWDWLINLITSIFKAISNFFVKLWNWITGKSADMEKKVEETANDIEEIKDIAEKDATLDSMPDDNAKAQEIINNEQEYAKYATIQNKPVNSSTIKNSTPTKTNTNNKSKTTIAKLEKINKILKNMPIQNAQTIMSRPVYNLVTTIYLPNLANTIHNRYFQIGVNRAADIKPMYSDVNDNSSVNSDFRVAFAKAMKKAGIEKEFSNLSSFEEILNNYFKSAVEDIIALYKKVVDESEFAIAHGGKIIKSNVFYKFCVSAYALIPDTQPSNFTLANIEALKQLADKSKRDTTVSKKFKTYSEAQWTDFDKVAKTVLKEFRRLQITINKIAKSKEAYIDYGEKLRVFLQTVTQVEEIPRDIKEDIIKHVRFLLIYFALYPFFVERFIKDTMFTINSLNTAVSTVKDLAKKDLQKKIEQILEKYQKKNKK